MLFVLVESFKLIYIVIEEDGDYLLSTCLLLIVSA